MKEMAYFTWIVYGFACVGCQQSPEDGSKAMQLPHARDDVAKVKATNETAGRTRIGRENMKSFVKQLQAEGCTLWSEKPFDEVGVALVLAGKDKLVRPDPNYQIRWEVPEDASKPIWLEVQNHDGVYEAEMTTRALREWQHFASSLGVDDISRQMLELTDRLQRTKPNVNGRREVEQTFEMNGYRASISAFDENDSSKEGKWGRIQIELTNR